jgi:hypothetical protein
MEGGHWPEVLTACRRGRERRKLSHVIGSRRSPAAPSGEVVGSIGGEDEEEGGLKGAGCGPKEGGVEEATSRRP